MGLKSDDTATMPLCASCHSDFHAAQGTFHLLGKTDRKRWQEAMVKMYRATWELSEWVRQAAETESLDTPVPPKRE